MLDVFEKITRFYLALGKHLLIILLLVIPISLGTNIVIVSYLQDSTNSWRFFFAFATITYVSYLPYLHLTKRYRNHTPCLGHRSASTLALFLTLPFVVIAYCFLFLVGWSLIILIFLLGQLLFFSNHNLSVTTILLPTFICNLVISTAPCLYCAGHTWRQMYHNLYTRLK